MALESADAVIACPSISTRRMAPPGAAPRFMQIRKNRRVSQRGSRMRNRVFFSVLTIASILSGAIPAGARAAERTTESSRHPNIVFILADDLGINDLGCYGRKDQHTPHLDRLARQGMRFTTAYAAQSVCSPSRAAILTGKSPARLHLTTFLPGRPDTVAQLLLHPRIEQQLPKGEKTVAELLKSAGYVSACIGKWHLGGKGSLPTDRGFDSYFPGHALTKPSAGEGGKGEYELTARAEEFIEANKNRPFFLYLAHNNPHVPLVAKAELIEKNKRAFNPVYAAMIETLDDCVGRIVARLEALGLAENTLIVFTSDNGGLHVLEGPFTPATYHLFRGGKGFCYEGGLRVPLIVRWPGKVKVGQVADTPVIGTDWTPTLLAIAGLAPPEKLDGVSLAGLLSGAKDLPPRALYWHQPHYTNQGGRPAGAIRLGDWKLVEDYENGRCELFSLAQDPRETTDRGAQEPARVADLRGRLESWRRDVGAQENTANPKFNLKLWRRLFQDEDASRLPPAETASVLALKLKPWRTLMNDVLPHHKDRDHAVPGPGAVILQARNATVHGDKLRYEPQPHKDTLGFWVQKDDWVEWEFAAPAAGVFEVELLQACGTGSGGADVEIAVNGQTLTMRVAETGHFQRFVPRTIGTVRLERGRQTLAVRAKSKPGAAVMDLRRIVLRGSS
jgi:arylsulfatase A